MTAELLLKVKSRKNPTGTGIRLASDYLATCGSHFRHPNDASIFQKCLKEAEKYLVYRDDTMLVAGGLFSPRRPDSAFLRDTKAFGATEPEIRQTANAVMDFACTLTSKRRDRDGDIMHPDGMQIDPAMPLLWQHLPLEPIGVLKRVLVQNSDLVRTHFAIADTKTGRDAAILAEFGALRVSHGFNPVAFKPVDSYTGSDMDEGWEITKSHVMEGSLVSIPANIDATITASSRGLLKSHMIGGWAKSIAEARPKQVVSGFEADAVLKNFDESRVRMAGVMGQVAELTTILKEMAPNSFTLTAGLMAKTVDLHAAIANAYRDTLASSRSGTVTVPQVVDHVRASHPGASVADVHGALKNMHASGGLTLQLTNDPRLDPRSGESIRTERGIQHFVYMSPEQAGTTKSSSAPTAVLKAAGDEQKPQLTPEAMAGVAPEAKPDDKSDKKKEETGDAVAGDADVPSVMLGDIKKIVETAAKVGELPREATDRINTLQGMVETAEQDMTTFSDDVVEANARQDVTAIVQTMQTLVGTTVDAMVGMIDEATKIKEIPGVPEEIHGHMDQLVDQASLVRDAVSNLADTAKEAEQSDNAAPGDQMPEPAAVGVPSQDQAA